MFKLINRAFIVSLSFITSLASMHDQTWPDQAWPDIFFIDLNPVELKYYPFIINLDKCITRCDSVDDLI